MRWAKSQQTYGNAKWHIADPANEVDDEASYWPSRVVPTQCGQRIKRPTWLADDHRPGLARNNVCARCKKAYLKTRPDLQGFVDRLNDKRDV